MQFYANAYKPFGILRSEVLLFDLIPKLNAPGRIDDPNKLYKYLIEENQFLYEYIVRINTIRKEKTDLELKRVETNLMFINNRNIAISKSNNKAINSILSSQIANKYKVLAITITQDEFLLTGSVRNWWGNDLVTFFKKINKKIKELNFGGHKEALGFRLPLEKWDEFVKALATIEFSPIQPAKQYTEKITLSDINHIQHDLLENEPYGRGKEEPVFTLNNIEIANARYTRKGHIMGECFDDKNETSYTVFLNKTAIPQQEISIKQKKGDLLCLGGEPITSIDFTLSWFLKQSKPCLNIRKLSA